jgi:hypothetical protein
MKKAGKIINIENNKVYIITANNEFVTVEKHTADPKIGDLYAGEKFQPISIWKYLLAFACILILSFTMRNLYLNNKYNFSVIVDMKCTLKLKINSSNKIIKVEGINSKGYEIKELVVLKHKSLNEALLLLLDQSIKQNYLTKAHADDGFRISIFISENNNNAINLSEFSEYANTQNFKVLLNNNGQATIE